MRSAIGRVSRAVRGWTGASAVDALASDLRALQQRVDELQRHVHELATHADEQRVRQGEDVDAIRAAITDVADDLAERIAALQPSRAATGGGAPR